MHNNIIGLKRNIVRLAPHNPKWKDLFEDEKYLIKNKFGDNIIRIEHVGSTAIPNLAAKPIIDIDVVVKSMKTAREMEPEFKEIGYEHRPYNGPDKWDELYVKGPKEKRTHYIHVTNIDDNHWRNDLLFRNFLIDKPEYAKEYEKLKGQLAKKYANDRLAYTQNKEAFIKEIIELARNLDNNDIA